MPSQNKTLTEQKNNQEWTQEVAISCDNQQNSPYIYAGNMTSAKLSAWLKDISDKITQREELPERISDLEEHVAKVRIHLDKVNACIDSSINRATQDSIMNKEATNAAEDHAVTLKNSRTLSVTERLIFVNAITNACISSAHQIEKPLNDRDFRQIVSSVREMLVAGAWDSEQGKNN
ncbi:hypothetical protein E0L31_012830 [Serratia marcescens]|uniref:Uncharacterized protein n=2 Tax=Serratia marcescens TaxID=615 RepID=A0A9X8VJC3_SERMA|nr:hypothetical protein [Serratia marcescens]